MIRPATFDDIPEMVKMSKDFCEAAQMPFDRSSTVRFMHNNIAAWDKLFLVVPGIVPFLKGMLIGLSVPWAADENCIIATELCWWVKPEHRKTRVAKELLEGFISWGKATGAKRIQMASLDLLDGERVGKIYEKLGFKAFEREYVLEPKE